MNAEAKSTGAGPEKVRVQIDFSRQKVEVVDRLVSACGLDTRKEFFNHALSLFEWAVKEVQTGREIGSINRATQDITVVNMPALTNIMQEKASVPNSETDTHKHGGNWLPERRLKLAKQTTA